LLLELEGRGQYISCWSEKGEGNILAVGTRRESAVYWQVAERRERAMYCIVSSIEKGECNVLAVAVRRERAMYCQ
jgi:hypothetical protein